MPRRNLYVSEASRRIRPAHIDGFESVSFTPLKQEQPIDLPTGKGPQRCRWVAGPRKDLHMAAATDERLGLVITTRLGFRLNNRPLMTHEDLERGIALLKRTSMRTIIRISDQAPVWILQTDPAHVDYLVSVSRTWPVPVSVVGRSGPRFEPGAFSGLTLPSGKFLCLRLDSDDFFFPDALRRTLSKYRQLPLGTLVDFPRGYQIELASHQVHFFSYAMQGPLYGIVTDRSDPLPAIGNHIYARRGRAAVAYLPRSWIQTVHGRNTEQVFRQNFMRRALSMGRQFRRFWRTRPVPELALLTMDLLPMPRGAKRRASELVG